MTKITATSGTATVTIEIEGTATVADLADNKMVEAVLDRSEKFTVLRDGIELGPDAPLNDGDEVEVVNTAGDKG